MGTASWALPVGVLAGICVLMFAFFWWWFPRHWAKGVQADIDEVDEARRQRELAAQGGDVELGAAAAKPKTFTYTPPAYTAY